MLEEQIPTILIVDDVAENIQVVASVLKHEGYHMAFATNGRSALETCEANRLDLILLDIMMPEMNGFEVCERLKKNPQTQNIPVIFLTAKTDTESIVRGFEVGGTDYITKPFNAAELLARVRTHIHLWQAEKRLRQSNASKERVISIIADELKRPFMGLRGVLQMVDEQFENLDAESVREYVGIAHQASANLADLLNNLLTWSTLQEGRLPMNPQMVDFEMAVSEVIEELRQQFTAKHIRFSLEPGEERFVCADRAMLTTVLRNLLTNAVMFSHEGGCVEVRTAPKEKGITVTVEDYGIGIGAEDQQKLFRIDKKFQRKGTLGEVGTGMGLILCRELLEQQGERIWLESEPGKGTKVLFTLATSKQEA